MNRKEYTDLGRDAGTADAANRHREDHQAVSVAHYRGSSDAYDHVGHKHHASHIAVDQPHRDEQQLSEAIRGRHSNESSSIATRKLKTTKPKHVVTHSEADSWHKTATQAPMRQWIRWEGNRGKASSATE